MHLDFFGAELGKHPFHKGQYRISSFNSTDMQLTYYTEISSIVDAN